MNLRELVLHDLWLKLFSLLIAVLVWETVSIAITARRPADEAPKPFLTQTNEVTR